MAIAFDAVTDGGNAIATSLTFSHTVGSGSDRLLVVEMMGATSGSGDGTCTFNGVSMTLAGKVQCPADRWTYLFYLLNPDTGTHDVVATSNDSNAVAAVASSYTGVGSYESNANTGTDASIGTITVSVTTVAANAWVFGSAKTGGTALTAGSNSSIRQAGSFLSALLERSDNPIGSPGSTGIQVTGYSVGCGLVVASFAPAGATTTRGIPLGNAGTAFAGGRTFTGLLRQRHL